MIYLTTLKWPIPAALLKAALKTSSRLLKMKSSRKFKISRSPSSAAIMKASRTVISGKITFSVAHMRI